MSCRTDAHAPQHRIRRLVHPTSPRLRRREILDLLPYLRQYSGGSRRLHADAELVAKKLAEIESKCASCAH